MSFILDALKKSENDRQEHSSAEFASVPSGTTTSGPPRWLWVLVALLAINVVVLLGLLLRDDTRAVASCDVDGDGDQDLVFGNGWASGQARSRLYLNDGSGTFTDATASRLPVDGDSTYSYFVSSSFAPGDLYTENEEE